MLTMTWVHRGGASFHAFLSNSIVGKIANSSFNAPLKIRAGFCVGGDLGRLVWWLYEHAGVLHDEQVQGGRDHVWICRAALDVVRGRRLHVGGRVSGRQQAMAVDPGRVDEVRA